MTDRYAQLHDRGYSPAEIAAMSGIDETWIRTRLRSAGRLATHAPSWALDRDAQRDAFHKRQRAGAKAALQEIMRR